MISLAVEYLNGWSLAAADGAAKSRAEWPPHPDRVFMALAAAYFETAGPDEEAEALRWLERQPAPLVYASASHPRVAVGGDGPPVSFVPVNDVKVGQLKDTTSPQKLLDQGLTVLPAHRKRQARSFPVAVPEDPVVHLVWEETGALPPSLHAGLASLCRKVTHVGHSASLVQMWVDADAPVLGPRRHLWVPDDGLDATLRMRVPYDGRLSYLAASDPAPHVRHAMTLGKLDRARYLDGLVDRLRPRNSRWQGYRRPGPRTSSEVEVRGEFDPRVQVLRLTGNLPATMTLAVVEALRHSMMAAHPDAPEWASGLTPDGGPSRAPHVSLVPLVNVGHAHGDGRLMGVGLALPRGVDGRAAATFLQGWLRDELGAPRQLLLAHRDWFESTAQLDEREVLPMTLAPQTWIRPSSTWVSVTPIVMDRHAHGRNRWSVLTEAAAKACEHIGLPRPKAVELSRAPFAQGAPRAEEFPPLRRPDGTARLHLHARLEFPETVAGPMILGAGRYRGYGLCRPQ